jgi:hypothetical protein
MTLGWRIKVIFKICLHIKDLKLLQEIKSFFEVGNINITSTRAEALYTVSNLKEIITKIIPHFDIYSLQSAKKIDYFLWKQCIELISSKEHLTYLGLTKIISIKGGLNRGLTDELKENFPDIISIIRPPFLIDELPLNPYWISGFSEGDSSFFISIRSSNNQVRLFYSIGLNEREYKLLIKIQSFFGGIGKITKNSSNNSVNFNVTRISELLNVIIPHFEIYKLKGDKSPHYLIWLKVIKLVNQKSHLTPEGLVEIKFLISNLNK